MFHFFREVQLFLFLLVPFLYSASFHMKECVQWLVFCLSDSNGMRTHNHVVCKRTLNQVVCKRTLNHIAKLAKRLTNVMSTYMYDAFECMLLSCHVCLSVSTLNSVPECPGTPCSKQASYLRFKRQQQDWNPKPLSL